MKDLLEYIVMNLVSKPENVEIDEQSDNGNVNLTLTVDPSDMGLIIGKGGQTIHSIRKLLTIRAIAENVRVNLQLSEPAGGASVPADMEQAEEPVENGEAHDVETPQEQESLEAPAEETPETAQESSEEKPKEKS